MDDPGADGDLDWRVGPVAMDGWAGPLYTRATPKVRYELPAPELPSICDWCDEPIPDGASAYCRATWAGGVRTGSWVWHEACWPAAEADLRR